MDFINLYFSSHGRLNRKGWWLSLIGLSIAIIILSVVLMFSLSWMGLDLELVQRLSNPIVNFLILYPLYIIYLKRLHDRERPEILAIVFLVASAVNVVLQYFEITGSYDKSIVLGQEVLAFVPNEIGTIVVWLTGIVGIWTIIELGILRGQTGPNTHGPDPSA